MYAPTATNAPRSKVIGLAARKVTAVVNPPMAIDTRLIVAAIEPATEPTAIIATDRAATPATTFATVTTVSRFSSTHCWNFPSRTITCSPAFFRFFDRASPTAICTPSAADFSLSITPFRLESISAAVRSAGSAGLVDGRCQVLESALAEF